MYIPIESYEQFTNLADFPREKVSDQLIDTVRHFHESDDIEELLLEVLSDPNRTPHGPVEIVDIMTLQLTYRNNVGVAGIILKGRSFQTVTPAHISHQVFRLRRISDLKFAVLGHVGNLLDEAREEFIQTAQELGVDYTIIDAADLARIAVIRGVLCPRDAKRLVNGHCTCGYRASGDSINVLQKEALARLKDAHELGQTSGVVVMPTGSGKTRIAAIDSNRFQAKRILYVAHTHEILDGAEREFAHIYGAGVVHRGWGFDDSLPTPSVHLCTIQSARSTLAGNTNSTYDYVIIDEFHHAAARTYQRLVSHIEPKFLLGLTATPFRSDRQDVVEICSGNIIINFELRSGIDTGILVPYHYYGCIDAVDYSMIQYRAPGYSISDLNRVLIIPERDKAIIRKWQNIALNLPTLAYCVSQLHAERMAASFREAGIPATEYLGTTPLDVRLSLIEKLQYGEIKVLCTVDVLNEGVDLPFVECLLFLRPTESKRIFFQQLGRGLRRSSGKNRVIVLDFIGNFHNAHRIVEYVGLQPEDQPLSISTGRTRSVKEIINLPLGCNVHFDDRVIDIFAREVLDPRHITRHNIAKILIYLYNRTSKQLGHRATRVEVDRTQILHSGLYELLFGSWKNFEKLMEDENVEGE